MKVLLVDDGKDMQEMIRMSLEFTGGNQVMVADDGPTGIEMAQKEHPDVVLLDVMMPRMDGYETCRRLRENEETKDIPVVFLTARAQAKDTEKGLQVGAAGYILKPFDAMKLNQEVREILANATSRQQNDI